jgi:hypothetical protein
MTGNVRRSDGYKWSINTQVVLKVISTSKGQRINERERRERERERESETSILMLCSRWDITKKTCSRYNINTTKPIWLITSIKPGNKE